MRKHVVDLAHGASMSIPLTRDEEAARAAEEIEAAEKVAARAQAQELRRLRQQAVEALLDGLLQERGGRPDAPQAIKDYLAANTP